MKHLILLGAPGSGKGTQAKILAERLEVAHLSTGDILRDEVRRGTELGNKAREYMDAGKLVSDALILEMIEVRLSCASVECGFILDGFPRTLPQAEGFDKLAERLGVQIDAVVNLEVDPEAIVKRLSARSTCSTCGTIYNDITKPPQRPGLCDLDNGLLHRRPDDSEMVVRHRLSVYFQQTKPLEEYYRSRGLIINVQGDNPVETVTADIIGRLETEKKKRRMIELKSPSEIAKIAEAGRIVAMAHKLAESMIQPGMETREIDDRVRELIGNEGGVPSFLGYRGYPASTCISINEVIVHGIPGRRKIKDGDLVSVDIGVYKDGFHADAARTYLAGNAGAEKRKITKTVREALEAGIAAGKPNGRLGDISAAIQRHAERNGFSVVRDLVGHGVGRALHEDPQIPNYGSAGSGPVLKPGMVLAIEPMINAGTWEIETLEDGWTIVTADRKLSAHWENTYAVTETGIVPLTVSEN